MRILIIGAGAVGFQLASMLSKEEHDVTVIENDEALINQIKEKVDAKIIVGSGTNINALEEANISQIELFLAVSSVDEVNIMSCLFAKEYGVKRCIARVHNNDFVLEGSKLSNVKLGIERIVNPDQVVSEEVSEICDFVDASEVANFFNNSLYHLCYPIKSDNPYLGKSLKGLSQINGEKKIVITSIAREDKTFIPSKEELIQEGDMIYFFCQKKDLKLVRKHFCIEQHSMKNIFIIGGGDIGFLVAKKLEETHHKVKFFDSDREVCDKIANQLNVDVFCTDNTDVETLEEEGISTADVVVTMMQDDYSNILTALLAKKLGAYKVVTVVNSNKLSSLAYSLGVDSTISPRLATASSILKYIRRGNIVSVVEKQGAEIIEIEVNNEAPITQKQIKDLKRPEGVILGAVKRGNEIKLLSGDDQIHKGDFLVVYCLSESISKLESFIEF